MIRAVRAVLGWLACPASFAATTRSGRWRSVRAVFLAGHADCEACGQRATTAHHVVPVQVDPARELDPANLIAFCRRCHLAFGHLGDWRSWNEDVRRDAAWFRGKVRSRPPGPHARSLV